MILGNHNLSLAFEVVIPEGVYSRGILVLASGNCSTDFGEVYEYGYIMGLGFLGSKKYSFSLSFLGSPY